MKTLFMLFLILSPTFFSQTADPEIDQIELSYHQNEILSDNVLISDNGFISRIMITKETLKSLFLRIEKIKKIEAYINGYKHLIEPLYGIEEEITLLEKKEKGNVRSIRIFLK